MVGQGHDFAAGHSIDGARGTPVIQVHAPREQKRAAEHHSQQNWPDVNVGTVGPLGHWAVDHSDNPIRAEGEAWQDYGNDPSLSPPAEDHAAILSVAIARSQRGGY